MKRSFQLVALAAATWLTAAPVLADENVTGSIKVEEGFPKSEALTKEHEKDHAKSKVPIASVRAKWAVLVDCPCDQCRVRQDIKGFVEFDTPDSKGSYTAKQIVEKTSQKSDTGEAKKAKKEDSEKSKTEFIPDVGAHGSSWYPKEQLTCEKKDKKSRLEFFDDPGTDAWVGEGAPLYRKYRFRLTFRTTFYCGEKEIGSILWHIKYHIPASTDGAKEVALGELK
jgi:hypothetical protein